MSDTGLLPIPLYLSYASSEVHFASAALKADPQASLLLSYFKKAAPGITTADALLHNYKALKVALGAFGLQGAAANTALLRQLLTQDPSAKGSLAQRLGNAKYLSFAKALTSFSSPPFADPAKIASIVSAYTTNTFEIKADKQAAGLQQALYFSRNIGSITSLNQLQSDPDLLKVVVTGLGLPSDNFSLLDFKQQTAILKSKVDLASFTKPSFVKRFAEQYLIAQQLNAAASTGPAPGTLAAAFDSSSDATDNGLLDILSSTTSDSSGSSSGALLSLFA